MSTLQVSSAWKISPSDLTFLFEECQACFWAKVAGNFPRPRMPFPRVFSLLDAQTKAYFDGKPTSAISPDLPPGRIIHGDRSVRSLPIHVPGHDRPFYIAGRIDAAIAFDDGTFAIIDFKTTVPKRHHTELYGRQLNAYAIAAEWAAPGNLKLEEVKRLGLLCFEPEALGRTRGALAYRGRAHWVEVPRDERAFDGLLTEVAEVVDRPSPPDPSPSCSFCSYLLDGVVLFISSALGHTPPDPSNGRPPDLSLIRGGNTRTTRRGGA